MPIEIGEGGIDHVGHKDEVDGLVRIALADAVRQDKFRHRQVFVCHPGGDFHDFVVIRPHVVRGFDSIAQTVEYGTARSILADASFCSAHSRQDDQHEARQGNSRTWPQAAAMYQQERCGIPSR